MSDGLAITEIKHPFKNPAWIVHRRFKGEDWNSKVGKYEIRAEKLEAKESKEGYKNFSSVEKG